VAKILVADDNSNIQKMVGLALKDQGIDVVAVGNGEAAVRKLAEVKPDLVLADVFMPVRNGYEVCKYIKDDPAFAHIPVILLVGAFDPLDEQEAQRVGADGVLKKPFVPPDPLISMVKSALLRAGVHIGPPVAGAEKTPEPSRAAADLQRANAKLAAQAQAIKVPEAEAEPIEEFPTMPAPVKIDAGHGPVAFGSLLGTPEVEDDAAFVPKGNGLEHNWGSAASDEIEEDEEQEEEHGKGWRPGGLETSVQEVAGEAVEAPGGMGGTLDWRDEAFHGNSPAAVGRSVHWTPTTEKSQFAEVAEAPSVGVTTLEPGPVAVSAPVPFSGDAWAAAMAAGVEEKIAEAAQERAAIVEEPVAEVATSEVVSHEAVVEQSAEVAEAEPQVVELKSEAAVEEADVVAPVVAEEKPEEVKKPEGGSSHWFSVPPSPWDVEARKASMLATTWDTPVKATEKSPDETQEIEAYGAQQAGAGLGGGVGKQDLGADNGTGVAELKDLADMGRSSAAPVHEAAEAIHETVLAAEPVKAEAPAPEMDELVARVLAKMNPDMMQKVTQEILKPIIEALVRDELGAKKS